MLNPLDFNAEQILKSSALQIFFSEDEIETVYKTLLKKWHPDVCHDKDASDVVSHINVMYDKARKSYANGGYPNVLKIGQNYYPYLDVKVFELGELYICQRHIIWAARREFDDLSKHVLEVVKSYKFPNEDVKSKITPFIPRNAHVKAYKDRAFLIMDRPHDFIRVIDILNKNGPIPPKHVAWILSRAYNIVGFLHYNNITHMDISAETFFIEPATHFGSLLGGWYYSGNKPIAAPSRSVHLAKFQQNTIHDSQIRTMGRIMCGAKSIAEMRRNADVPEAIKTWLIGPAMDNIHQAEQEWKGVIISAFGEKKFTEYNLKTSDIYSF